MGQAGIPTPGPCGQPLSATRNAPADDDVPRPPADQAPATTPPQAEGAEPSEATLLKEWEVRHNGAMQLNTQFLAVGTVVTTAMTAGLGYAVNVADPAARRLALGGLAIVSVGFTL